MSRRRVGAGQAGPIHWLVLGAVALLLVACSESSAGDSGTGGVTATTSATGGAGAGQGATGGVATGTGTGTGGEPNEGGGGTSASSGCNPGNSNTFTDDFEDGALDPNWTSAGDATIEEVGGELQFTLPQGSEGSVATVQSYDLRGCTVSVRFTTAPGAGSMQLTFRHTAGTRLTVGARSSQLFASHTVINSPFFSATQPISGGFTGYLRIREQGGGIYFEYSTDGQSWQRIFSGGSAPDTSSDGTAEDGEIVLEAHPPLSTPDPVVLAFDDLNLP